MLEPIITWLGYQLVNFFINVLWGLALGLWYIEKAVAWLGDQIITNSIWETIIDGMLTGLANSMPDTLREIMFGAGGGLFYLALVIVGLFLIVPFITQAQPALEIQRVFGWTLVVVALFITSTSGYDVVALVERSRMGMMSNIASGYGSNQVSQLVAGPMSATAAEINVTDFELPTAYEAIYFPDPTAFDTLDVVFYDAPILGSSTATLTVETEASLNARVAQASLGIVLVILNLVPMGMVVILVSAFVGLTATSLVILLFFIMALPLGMFESGMLVITQILRRYMLVWILSIFIAIFPGTLLGVAQLTLVPPITLEALFLYVGVLLVAVYATYHVARWVFNIATESFSVIGQSLNAVAFGSAVAGSGGDARGTMLAGRNSGAPLPNRLPPTAAVAAVGSAAVAPALIGASASGMVLGTKALPYAIAGGVTSGTFGQVQKNNPRLQITGWNPQIRTGEQNDLIDKMTGARLNSLPVIKEVNRELVQKEGGLKEDYLMAGKEPIQTIKREETVRTFPHEVSPMSKDDRDSNPVSLSVSISDKGKPVESGPLPTHVPNRGTTTPVPERVIQGGTVQSSVKPAPASQTEEQAGAKYRENRKADPTSKYKQSEGNHLQPTIIPAMSVPAGEQHDDRDKPDWEAVRTEKEAELSQAYQAKQNQNQEEGKKDENS